MKPLSYLILLITGLAFTGCSKLDDPAPVNQEEVITSMLVTLKPAYGETVTLTSRDLDGDGPEAPFIEASGPLGSNITYDGEIVLLNETTNPAGIISDEVKNEAGQHQFFYAVAGSVNADFAYADKESDYADDKGVKFVGSNPVGITFILKTGDPGKGNISITLIHEPDKNGDGVRAGDSTNAAGETDFAATFPVAVE